MNDVRKGGWIAGALRRTVGFGVLVLLTHFSITIRSHGTLDLREAASYALSVAAFWGIFEVVMSLITERYSMRPVIRGRLTESVMRSIVAGTVISCAGVVVSHLMGLPVGTWLHHLMVAGLVSIAWFPLDRRYARSRFTSG